MTCILGQLLISRATSGGPFCGAAAGAVATTATAATPTAVSKRRAREHGGERDSTTRPCPARTPPSSPQHRAHGGRVACPPLRVRALKKSTKQAAQVRRRVGIASDQQKKRHARHVAARSLGVSLQSGAAAQKKRLTVPATDHAAASGEAAHASASDDASRASAARLLPAVGTVVAVGVGWVGGRQDGGLRWALGKVTDVGTPRFDGETAVVVHWLQCGTKERQRIEDWSFGLVYEDPLDALPRPEHILSDLQLRCRNAGRAAGVLLCPVVGDVTASSIVVIAVDLQHGSGRLTAASAAALSRLALRPRFYADYGCQRADVAFVLPHLRRPKPTDASRLVAVAAAASADGAAGRVKICIPPGTGPGQ